MAAFSGTGWDDEGEKGEKRDLKSKIPLLRIPIETVPDPDELLGKARKIGGLEMAGFRVWVNPEGVEVFISGFRQAEEHVQIPGGDRLIGHLPEIENQLRRRNFSRA